MRPGRIALVEVLVAAALLPALAPGLAYAGGPSTDAAEAQAPFEEGRRLMAAHDYAAACPKFAGSEEREPAAGTALNLAVCYARHTDSASAVSTGNAATAVVVIGAVVAATGAVVWLVAPGRHAESSVGVGINGQEIFLRRAF